MTTTIEGTAINLCFQLRGKADQFLSKYETPKYTLTESIINTIPRIAKTMTEIMKSVVGSPVLRRLLENRNIKEFAADEQFNPVVHKMKIFL
jgi:hypothetical protein